VYLDVRGQEETTGKQRKLCDEEIHNLPPSLNIREIKSRRLRCAGHLPPSLNIREIKSMRVRCAGHLPLR
jgi:hypothetical protein